MRATSMCTIIDRNTSYAIVDVKYDNYVHFQSHYSARNHRHFQLHKALHQIIITAHQNIDFLGHSVMLARYQVINIPAIDLRCLDLKF